MSCKALRLHVTSKPCVQRLTFRDGAVLREWAAGGVVGFSRRSPLLLPSPSRIKLCVCHVSPPAGSFHHTYAYVLALDIIISRFVQGGPEVRLKYC